MIGSVLIYRGVGWGELYIIINIFKINHCEMWWIGFLNKTENWLINMATICPKCCHTRQPNETAPDWQCPACGVAYAKVAHLEQGIAPPLSVRATASRAVPEKAGIPWIKLILILLLVWGSWMGGRLVVKKIGTLMVAEAGSDNSEEALQRIAATVKPGDVVMYSTTECTYCIQAKSWLNQNGFAFTECNMSVDSRCEREFMSYGGTGTPYLVVRGHHMKNGFDSEEFLTALK